MKNPLKTLMAALACLCAWSAFCDSLYEDQDGIRWYYTVTNGEATIIAQGRSLSGDIVFPETLGGYPVVALRENSIYSAGNATSVTFPDSFRTFGARNFYYAQSLTNMTFGTGLRDFSPFQNHICKVPSPYSTTE